MDTKKTFTLGELIHMQNTKSHQDTENPSDEAAEKPEYEDRIPFRDDDLEPAGFERIRRQRPHRAPREDKKGRRPNRDGKPLW